jgi:hypothetical protein
MAAITSGEIKLRPAGSRPQPPSVASPDSLLKDIRKGKVLRVVPKDDLPKDETPPLVRAMKDRRKSVETPETPVDQKDKKRRTPSSNFSDEESPAQSSVARNAITQGGQRLASLEVAGVKIPGIGQQRSYPIGRAGSIPVGRGQGQGGLVAPHSVSIQGAIKVTPPKAPVPTQPQVSQPSQATTSTTPQERKSIFESPTSVAGDQSKPLSPPQVRIPDSEYPKYANADSDSIQRSIGVLAKALDEGITSLNEQKYSAPGAANPIIQKNYRIAREIKYLQGRLHDNQEQLLENADNVNGLVSSAYRLAISSGQVDSKDRKDLSGREEKPPPNMEVEADVEVGSEYGVGTVPGLPTEAGSEPHTPFARRGYQDTIASGRSPSNEEKYRNVLRQAEELRRRRLRRVGGGIAAVGAAGGMYALYNRADERVQPDVFRPGTRPHYGSPTYTPPLSNTTIPDSRFDRKVIVPATPDTAVPGTPLSEEAREEGKSDWEREIDRLDEELKRLDDEKGPLDRRGRYPSTPPYGYVGERLIDDEEMIAPAPPERKVRELSGWETNPIEWLYPADPLLRPSYNAGGAGVIDTVNQDPTLVAVDALQWNQPKDYYWEANNQPGNPLVDWNEKEDEIRFANPLSGPTNKRKGLDLSIIQDMANTDELDLWKPSLKRRAKELYMNIYPDDALGIQDGDDIVRSMPPTMLPAWADVPATNPLQRFTAGIEAQETDRQIRGNPGVDSAVWSGQLVAQAFIQEANI